MSHRQAVTLSVTLFLLLMLAPFPVQERRVFAGLLVLAWLFFCINWLIRRFGRIAVVALVILALLISSTAWYIYWQDEPTRNLVAQIRECHPYYIGTTGGEVILGKVDYVYFDSGASDDDVRRFTELEGLTDLRRLVFVGTRLSDATVMQFKRFSELEHLYIEGTKLSDETIEFLLDVLPDCRIDVK
jgi:hypothetical protein